MPSRVMRAEILSSESLSQVSLEADLLFRSLILVADDFGRLDGRLKLLRLKLFPLRPSVTLKKIERWLAELLLLNDPPVMAYIADGRPYLTLTGWERHRGKSRRAQSSKFPKPPEVSKNETNASPEILGNSGDPPVGKEVEARVRKRERSPGHPREIPASPSPDFWDWDNPNLIDKPNRFEGDAKKRILVWADDRGHSRRILNDGLELWEEWTEPVKGPKRRTVRGWIGSFERMIRRALDEGQIVRETDREKYQRELAASPLSLVGGQADAS